MSDHGEYFVYILASRSRGALYVGVTNDIGARVALHRAGEGSRHVARYQIFRLVHCERYADPRDAIVREKQLKRWHRDWKFALIERDNPGWNDLFDSLLV